jgi:hypothetical protein
MTFGKLIAIGGAVAAAAVIVSPGGSKLHGAASLVGSTATFAAHDGTARSRALHFIVKDYVPRGQLAHVLVEGLSGLCRISVSKGGAQMRLRPRPRVNPLRPKLSRASQGARVAWEWRVPTNAPVGVWLVRVDCDHAPTLRGTFVVTGWTTP